MLSFYLQFKLAATHQYRTEHRDHSASEKDFLNQKLKQPVEKQRIKVKRAESSIEEIKISTAK